MCAGAGDRGDASRVCGLPRGLGLEREASRGCAGGRGVFRGGGHGGGDAGAGPGEGAEGAGGV
ncbi:hypothetical protein GC173_08115 [bacterium]|nr:hypothetical protein [bacterium]